MGPLEVMNRILNLNWVRSFEASARHLSFTQAAHELNMTQAGVSQHIRLLEQHLHEPLFHRLPRGLQLTDAGEAYLHVVRESFERLDGGTEEIFGHGGEGVVSVRTNLAFVNYWLAPRLPLFHAEHPAISVRLTAEVHGLDTVWDGVDMEIRYGREHAPGLVATPLTADQLFPVCAPELVPSLRKPQDLLTHRLLHVIGNRFGWAEWFRAAGVRAMPAGPFLQTDTSAIALELAAAGAGVALGHSSLVEPLLRSKRLARPFRAALATPAIFYLVMPSGRQLQPDAATFRSWLLREAKTPRPKRPD
jgi:LysR family transcriptional regulator, glycine cleavage system transcriptional activator